MKLREGITQEDLNQALMNAVLTALNAQGKTDTNEPASASNGSPVYEDSHDEDEYTDIYEDDSYEDNEDLDLFNTDSEPLVTDNVSSETVEDTVVSQNIWSDESTNQRPTEYQERVDENTTQRPVEPVAPRHEAVNENSTQRPAEQVSPSNIPNPERNRFDVGGSNATAHPSGGSRPKIVPISVKQLPAVREQIPEDVDFFTKSKEEKFRDVDDAVKNVAESMKPDASYIDIASDVTDMAIKRLKIYATKGVNDGAKKAYSNKKSNRHLEDSSLFSNDTVIIGDKPVKYTRHVEIPQWSLDLHECLTEGDKANNFDQVRMKITEELINYFGGFKRINRVYVASYQLIINDVCYIPKLSTQVLSRLPYDCADYIMNGNLAPFFNWSYLYKMNSLNTLSFDDVDFVTTYVADDIGTGRDFKPILLFKHCKNLTTLCIGSDIIRYPLPEEETAREEMEQTIANVEYETHKSNYFYGKCEKYYGALFNSTKAVRQWSVGNLVNYAHNRGDKGILRFTGGLLMRTTVAAGLAVPEAVTRVAGGIFGGIASTIRSAKQVTTQQGNGGNGGNTQDGL